MNTINSLIQQTHNNNMEGAQVGTAPIPSSQHISIMMSVRKVKPEQSAQGLNSQPEQ